MHQIVARPPEGIILHIHVDPLRVPRGHRALPRGGVHATVRKAARAKRKRLLREELARES